MRKKVLSVSADLRRMVTRNNALAIAGYSVSSPRTTSDSVQLLGSEQFSAVIIGNSIPPQERRALIQAMRSSKPEVAILFVTVVPGLTEPDADESIDVSVDIAPLFEALARIVPA